MQIESGQRAEYFDGCYLVDVVIRGIGLDGNVEVFVCEGPEKSHCLSVPLISLVFDNSNVDKVAS